MQHLIVRKIKSGVAFLFLDSPGKQNFLTSEVIEELALAITDIEDDPTVRTVVLISGKADTFVAGADLHEIMRFKDESDGLKLSRRGHEVFEMLAHSKKPSVAAINGMCVGGGLELVLCCDRRVATDSPNTVFGLPEVSHGLIPGLGGTQRLPRQIGIQKALALILGAEIVNASSALDLKIVDQVVSPDHLLQRAEKLALQLLEIPKDERKIVAPELAPEKLSKLFSICERSLRIKTKGRYPAQLQVLDVIRKGLEQGIEAGLEAEITTFAKLSVSETSRNLVFLFFTKELAKQCATIASRYSSNPIKTVAIVTQKSSSVKKLAEVIRANDLDGSIQVIEHAQTLEAADLIIEASTTTTKAIKLEILINIANAMKPNAVLATCTNSFSIEHLAKLIPKNENFIGMQFIHPIDQMPLVELIAHSKCSKHAVAQATSFTRKIKKLPQMVQDSPGFLLNRILTTYLQQAARLAESGTPVNWIEKSAIDFGMPIGPFAVLDEVGLDLAHTVATTLNEKLGDRFIVPRSLTKAINAGMIGRKSGCGTYIWQDDKKTSLNHSLKTDLGFDLSDLPLPAEQRKQLAAQMILPMVDEAARCLEEKVVRRAREIDLCLVLGIGFPSFRGGLLRYADSIGIKQIIADINEIYTQTAPASQISDYLKRLVEENRGFYTRAVEQN
jgi:3-hydroxyacyl-CoA dehydrogenase / enoyl-CoA hydratase / 3-hydroxybutyryl-CoA epimerase